MEFIWTLNFKAFSPEEQDWPRELWLYIHRMSSKKINFLFARDCSRWSYVLLRVLNHFLSLWCDYKIMTLFILNHRP